MTILIRGRAKGPRGPGTAHRALALSLLNTVISKLGTLGIGIVLARLLGPAQFGTYAIAFVALLAILSFNELGVSLAIVRWPSDPREIAPTVTTISIASSAIIFVGAFLGAPAFAAAMGDPGATDVVRVMAFCVMVNGAVATPAALLQRDFRQGTRLVIDQVNVWVGALVSIGLVLLGYGAMSLAVGRVLASVISAVLFVVYSPSPIRLGLDLSKLGPLLRFGLPLAGSSIVAFAVGYVDQIVAGQMLGSVTLGLYVLATNLGSWPAAIFSQPLRGVAPPAFAKMQHDQTSMQGAMLSLVSVTAVVVFPVVTVMAAQAAPLVLFVYGQAWASAASALTWLAVAVGLRILFELTYDYLVVLGRSGAIFKVQLAWMVALVPALIIGASMSGLVGVASAVFGVSLVAVLPLYVVLLVRHGFALTALARVIWLPAAVCIPLGLASWWLGRAVPVHALSLILAATLGTCVIAALLWTRRSEVADIRSWGRK